MAPHESFAAFWAAYPRRVKRKYAYDVWLRLKPDVELLDRILTALEWQTREWQQQSTELRYIPHPSSWLNGARWEDEPMQPLPEPERETWTEWKQKHLTH